ncbi:aldolase/citrate lyase family protein [Williamsia sterculiae]|uniref:aldolase/citrate lyase family protein n=1 Tax=Williamsia sterculiae TaxID=1344003 RepID=UPI001F18C2C3|nr:aldolase/citrate lyase family protein [Williamsia sterculiae]
MELTRERLPVPVIALIESATGMENASSLSHTEGVTRLAFGIGDFRRDTGIGGDPMALAYPRSRLVIASRAAGLPGPIDGPTIGASIADLAADIVTATGMGMTGKLCLRTAQAPIINQQLRPDDDEVEWATGVIRKLTRPGVVVDGADKPRLARARALLERDEAFR